MCLCIYKELVIKVFKQIFEYWIKTKYGDSTMLMKDINGSYSCTNVKYMWAAFYIGMIAGERLCKKKQKSIQKPTSSDG